MYTHQQLVYKPPVPYTYGCEAFERRSTCEVVYIKAIIMIIFPAQIIFGGIKQSSTQIKPFGLDIISMASNGPLKTNQIAILNSFKSSFKQRGILNTTSPMYEILLTIKKLNATQTIVSVTILQLISHRLIELGKKNQVFYGAISEKEKHPPKNVNNEIREYVSGEYIKQYRMVLDSDIFIISDNLDEEVEKTILKILEKPYLKGYAKI